MLLKYINCYTFEWQMQIIPLDNLKESVPGGFLFSSEGSCDACVKALFFKVEPWPTNDIAYC